jgi:hypothetical protein
MPFKEFYMVNLIFLGFKVNWQLGVIRVLHVIKYMEFKFQSNLAHKGSLNFNFNSILILKSSNKESCSLFNSLQVHILFGIFWAQKDHLLIESIQIDLKLFKQRGKASVFVGRPTGPPMLCAPCAIGGTNTRRWPSRERPIAAPRRAPLPTASAPLPASI